VAEVFKIFLKMKGTIVDNKVYSIGIDIRTAIDGYINRTLV
jgi:hypothetical protein